MINPQTQLTQTLQQLNQTQPSINLKANALLNIPTPLVAPPNYETRGGLIEGKIEKKKEKKGKKGRDLHGHQSTQRGTREGEGLNERIRTEKEEKGKKVREVEILVKANSKKE